jgi:hypothetical protein
MNHSNLTSDLVVLQLPSRYVDSGALFAADSPNSSDRTTTANVCSDSLALSAHQLQYLRQLANRIEQQQHSSPSSSGRPGYAHSVTSGDCESDLDEMEVANNLDDFLQTGRTGRRNAVPDIEGDKDKDFGTGDLPLQMNQLSCSGTCHLLSLSLSPRPSSAQLSLRHTSPVSE